MVGTSAVCAIAFLFYSVFPMHGRKLFIDFTQIIEIIPDTAYIDLAINIADIKKSNYLKLPDAIIAATALHRSATLTSMTNILTEKSN